MKRPYHDVTPMISPNQFKPIQRSNNPGGEIHSEAVAFPESRNGWIQEATVLHAPGGRFGARGSAEDARDGETVDAEGTFRTPLRAKIAAIHAARDATHRINRSG